MFQLTGALGIRLRRDLLVLGLLAVACHRARVQRNPDVGPIVKDTSRVVTPVTDPGVISAFKDTAPASVFSAEGRIFKLPQERQSLRAILRKERQLWQAIKPGNYRFLLRVGCFCPGTRGWLLIEVRSNLPLRAWDVTGKSAALTDWNTFSIDGLYDNLERMVEIHGEVQVAFDPRWHFSRYVRTVALPGPDMWSVIELRALRPI